MGLLQRDQQSNASPHPWLRPWLAAGYLPGSDKATTTQAGSTLAAVEAACDVLKPGGLLSILCYTGHPGGPTSYR